jgi:hypothetical protein
MGQTEKYSERADVFRSSPDSRHSRSRLARLSSGGTERFHSISNIPRMPHGECPAPRLSRLTRFYDLLAGWKLDRSLFIRHRPNGRFAPGAAIQQLIRFLSLLISHELTPFRDCHRPRERQGDLLPLEERRVTLFL